MNKFNLKKMWTIVGIARLHGRCRFGYCNECVNFKFNDKSLYTIYKKRF